MKTILIIDDEASMRHLFSRILAKNGYKVLTSSTGVDGLRMIKENTVDLVLVDFVLPDIHGIDVIKGVRKEAGNLPEIIITGYESDETEKEAKRLGVAGYIHKPFDLTYMKGLIKKTLEGG